MTAMSDASPTPSTDPVDAPDGPHEWHRVLDPDELDSLCVHFEPRGA